MIEDIKTWFKHSLTILWARLVTFSGVVMAIALEVVGDPTVNTAVQSLINTKYVPYFIIAFGLITEIVRWRTVSKATDENNKVVS